MIFSMFCFSGRSIKRRRFLYFDLLFEDVEVDDDDNNEEDEPFAFLLLSSLSFFSSFFSSLVFSLSASSLLSLLSVFSFSFSLFLSLSLLSLFLSFAICPVSGLIKSELSLRSFNSCLVSSLEMPRNLLICTTNSTKLNSTFLLLEMPIPSRYFLRNRSGVRMAPNAGDPVGDRVAIAALARASLNTMGLRPGGMGIPGRPKNGGEIDIDCDCCLFCLCCCCCCCCSLAAFSCSCFCFSFFSPMFFLMMVIIFL
mmetsp:Transcript_14927/g.23329  ORF Transcript_14927/g.23329 Transcript_14927/m.23329 type:complete len:254 (-) Transcript_14927:603-1364(-)